MLPVQIYTKIGRIPSPFPLELGPLNPARGPGERYKLLSESERSPAAERILVHFQLKSRHLGASVVMTPEK